MSDVSFFSAVLAIAQIFLMGMVGFGLVKKGIVNDAGLKLLSYISVNIAFPMFIFNQILQHFNPKETPLWWGYPLVNIGLTLLGLTLAWGVFSAMGKKIKDEALAASSLHNAGYIPLMLSLTLPLGVMSGKIHAAIILSIIGFDLCLWSIGLWLMTRQTQPKMNLLKMFNPPLISMVTAVLIVLCWGPVKVDDVWLKPLKIMGDAAMGLSMIVIGGNLGMTQIFKINSKEMMTVVLLKTCVIPSIALGMLIIFKLDPVLSFVVMVQACMPTAITLSIIGRHHGTRNQDFINTAVFITHLACIITLPLFLGLYGKWVKS